jgi:hypothetical protein
MSQVNFNSDSLTGMTGSTIHKQIAISTSSAKDNGNATIPFQLSTLPEGSINMSNQIAEAMQKIEIHSPDALRHLTILGKPGTTDISDEEKRRLDIRLVSTPDNNPPLSNI